jgi:hypothetical protein
VFDDAAQAFGDGALAPSAAVGDVVAFPHRA